VDRSRADLPSNLLARAAVADVHVVHASSSISLTSRSRAYTVHVNLIRSPVPQTNFGIEFIRVQGKLQDGQTSEGTRFQASAQFKF
jgi:hypothetical protein